MKKIRNKNKGITLVALIITIIILLILSGITIATLGGENGLFKKVKLGKERYAISESKEKLELEITNLQIEQNGKGEELTKEDLPKMNSDEIDVRDTTNFPVEVIYKNYKFEVDSNFKVTYVGEANETIITYTTEPEGYTNQNNIKVLVKITNPKGIKSILKPGETDKILPQDRTTAGIEFTVTKNGHYILKVEDVDGNEVSKDIYIDLIDTLAPEEFTPEVQKNGSTITIVENGKDAEATEESSKSGIDHYEYYLIDSSNKETKYDNNKIENLALGTYKVYLIAFDKAGNSRKSKEVEFKIAIEFKEISTGDNHCLGIDSEGKLWSWGSNGYGQLGDGTTTRRYNPVQIVEDTQFIQISAGNAHSLAIDRNGNLWSWGYNYAGQLGDGTKNNKLIPTIINTEVSFTHISAGEGFSLAIDNSGNIWSWGRNGSGQLGNGTYEEKLEPVQITTGRKFTQISAGAVHSLAIDSEGNLWTWGYNRYGQLGDGTKVDKSRPIEIKKGTKFVQIAAGYLHSLAIDSEGNLWTWGYNEYGQLGDISTNKEGEENPFNISQMWSNKFIQISAGGGHSIAIDVDGKLWTWGYNYYGQLGNGTKRNSGRPINIKNGTIFTGVFAGNYHNIAKDNDGNLWAWGLNGDGQLGDGTQVDRLVPVQIN
mgnify:FL=1